MKPREEADDNLRRVMINLVVIAVFTILMGTAIVYMYDAEPDIEAELMDGYARQFAGSATNAHQQWYLNRLLLQQYPNQRQRYRSSLQ